MIDQFPPPSLPPPPPQPPQYVSSQHPQVPDETLKWLVPVGRGRANFAIVMGGLFTIVPFLLILVFFILGRFVGE